MKSNVIRLSWPRRALWENEKASHMVKAAAKRMYRKEAWALALEAKWPKDPRAVLSFRFCPPDRRKRDAHNLPATQKAAIDGIADAMRVDDQGFRCLFPAEFGPVEKGGAVYVEIKGEIT
ncbi:MULTISPECIES: hypothetical protein [unclassified Phaeobacter]|uniref:hypothetical protein n=2 Tax=unclassified Phaeobacter TaxID=2621772 RepID=UPI003A84C810